MAVVTYLPLCDYRYIPGFFKQLSAVESQLRTTPGLLRYGLRASLLGKRFWTYSLWEDRASIEGFIYGASHRVAVLRFHQWDGGARLRVFKTNHVKLSWTEALQRLDRGLPDMTNAN